MSEHTRSKKSVTLPQRLAVSFEADTTVGASLPPGNTDLEADTAVGALLPPPRISLVELMNAYAAVIYVLAGRGRVGKTFIGNLLVKRIRGAGHRVMIVDADDANDGLTKFYGEEAEQRGETEAVDTFIRRTIDKITSTGGLAVWDAGGNDETLNDFASSMRFTRYLREKRIAVVMLYVFGEDLSDLSNIVTIDRRKAYEPQKVILCANLGAPKPPKAKAVDPLASLTASSAVGNLVQQGAGLMTIPAFDYTDELNERDLDLFDAIAGKVEDGVEPLGPSTEFEIKCWWEEVEAAFAEQGAWLP